MKECTYIPSTDKKNGGHFLTYIHKQMRKGLGTKSFMSEEFLLYEETSPSDDFALDPLFVFPVFFNSDVASRI
jgi:hypothetical protein